MESSKIVTDFSYPYHEIEIEFIPLTDGTRLSARYWLPDNATDMPVPAILEYIPYCTRDGTAARDEAMHPFFAGHGYAAIRVDMRGSGESDGVLLDEYLTQEQDDALEVIAWIASQPWCNGNVGMMGKSWGGFNSLQVAARKPPALKCIVTVYSTDDRYADDIHHMGGCLINNNPSWSFVMFGNNARPPDPALVGERWRDLWMQRLEANQPWIIEWLRHQTRDEFWKHGSVCENYSDIEIPVYAIGGWADGYSNPVPRLVDKLSAPCKALIGPWGHQYMHQAAPGPMMGYMSEALRWWDYWLKGIDTGIMNEPRYRVWQQDSIEPLTSYAVRPGRWIAEDSWPSSRVTPREFRLNTSGLGLEPETSQRLIIKSPLDTGLCSPAWLNHGDLNEPTEPGDQRSDDMGSLWFDSAPLEANFDILGAPALTLTIDVDQPIAMIAARLCEVLPCGASTRVSYGVLNLTHTNNHETIECLKTAKSYTVRVQLNDIAHRFSAGNKIRIAIATSHWPVVWPSPVIVTLGLHTGISQLTLPHRAIRQHDEHLAPLPSPTQCQPHPTTLLQTGTPVTTTVQRDIATGKICVCDESDSGRERFDRHGWEVRRYSKMERSLFAGDPLSARTTLTGRLEFGRSGEMNTRSDIFCDMWSDADCFHIKATLDAFEEDRPVFSRTWLESIPRKGI